MPPHNQYNFVLEKTQSANEQVQPVTSQLLHDSRNELRGSAPRVLSFNSTCSNSVSAQYAGNLIPYWSSVNNTKSLLLQELYKNAPNENNRLNKYVAIGRAAYAKPTWRL